MKGQRRSKDDDMASLKKRYPLSLDFEVEVKDFTAVPVPRDEWFEDTSPLCRRLNAPACRVASAGYPARLAANLPGSALAG